MPTYQYRCDDDGPFEVAAAMGARRSTTCPTCGRPGRRVFTVPHLATADPRRVAAIERSERSAHEPEVVRSLPAASRRPRVAPTDPALRRLPRP